MKPAIFPFFLAVLSLPADPVYAAKSEFPGRELYLAVPVIELEDLYKRRNKVVIVDVRSGYEYKTLRIKNALSVPLSAKNFIERMKKLRVKSGTRPIVVYCNGKTCMKSYKAASKCRDHGINNIIAYDAGVMDWARKYPAESVLLGKSPINPNRLISSTNFKKHLLKPRRFEERVANPNTLVIDVRDEFQREGIGIFVGREVRAPLDEQDKVDRLINQARRERKTLLVYDQAGKQVRWLMYHLEDKGLRSYYFMQGGASAYFDELRKEFVR